MDVCHCHSVDDVGTCEINHGKGNSSQENEAEANLKV